MLPAPCKRWRYYMIYVAPYPTSRHIPIKRPYIQAASADGHPRAGALGAA